MTSQGTASGRFTRAVQTRNLFMAEVALKEMGNPSLLLALDYLVSPSPVEANLRVYSIEQAPKATDFNFTLQPGVAHGIVMGPVTVNRGYVSAITPLNQSDFNGASIKSFVEPEFNGASWNDVLRVILNGGSQSVTANVRAYSILPNP